MKKKNGFVFLESVIVLVVVALALTGFLVTYTVLSNNSRRKEHYDNTSDKYLLYSISSLGTTADVNFTSFGDFRITIDNAKNSVISENFYSQHVNADGEIVYEIEEMFNATGLVYLYYIDKDHISTVLQQSSSPTFYYDNGTIEYLKTLDINKQNYLVGVFKRSDKFYYASINL